ncbi:DNA/RNA helicase domain-containing protein [Streptomyces griseoflavus]|uniref:DNA/RNA helicase domain-containing protein n=1 Tax=Streptomyces griseoflavus TaxID=35619 RepID=UPI00167D77C4|nr:DNA/RNA helicase domain-containing protein [Streptomyces griseoflavus]GGV37808.1 ATP-binding protein [Streptomyces griseoflavus]
MLFRASAKTVAVMALDGSLFLHLTDQFVHMHGYRPGTSEIRSWERSLPVLAAVLEDAGLGDVEMMLEYALPLNSKRADAVLAGVHPTTGEPSYVVVELKQWSQAEPDEDDPALCRIDAYRHSVLNPIEQVRLYCEYLVNFNGAVAEHPDRVSGVAFLHNATEFGVSGLRAVELDKRGQLFTGERRGEFIDHLRTRLSGRHPGARAADELRAGRTVPSKQLMSVAAQEVREREQFVLLDEQQVAYRMVLNAVRRAKQSDHKEVVVITGGPGTGKSVIALSLLGELYRQGVPALHATGSQSFTKTMRKVAGARKREVQELFKYFNSFMTTEKNTLDVLICDEAHRIRETSANRYTPAAHRTGKRQIEELIDVARVPVFLLDEHQVVRPGEMGTVQEIKAAAVAKGLECRVVPLESQFRCGGSDAYLRWVVRLLGLEPGGAVVWEPDDRMRLLAAESPQEMEAFLQARRSEGYGARMSAGYCWTWSPEPKPGDPLPADVVIGDWSRPWNLRGERSVSGAPPSALWATDPAGFGQVGCVYTAQGFEYDWSGVIIGPDLLWRGDRWVTDRTASKDPVFKRSTPDDDVDRLIRNTYKVLLTRGMVGTIVYSTDPETREKLRELAGGRLERRASTV